MSNWTYPLPDEFTEYRGSVKKFFKDIPYASCNRQTKYFLDKVYEDATYGVRWWWSLDREFDSQILEDHEFELHPNILFFLRHWNEIVYAGKGAKRLRIVKREDGLYKLGIYSGIYEKSSIMLTSGSNLSIVLREFGAFGYGPAGKATQRTY